jgi:colicin import membrane protein
VENQKKAAQEHLQARRSQLKEKGINPGEIERDALMRKIRAAIRKAEYRLSSIAAQDQLNLERAKAKAEKLAAEKAAREKAPEKAEAEPSGKKGPKTKSPKKEKTEAPKEKKEKKEKKPKEQKVEE